jgi:hypothetical protein
MKQLVRKISFGKTSDNERYETLQSNCKRLERSTEQMKIKMNIIHEKLFEI